jgi:TPP-dependent pyruvate/acetoin dehydrogenase alpha subunit
VVGGGRSERVTTFVDRRNEILDDRVKCFERLIEIRRFEERVQQLFDDGQVHGTTHLANGQEAVAVALARAIRPTDIVTCTYRSHAMALALGMTPDSVVAEIMGRETGCIGGVGGSMHLSDSSIGLLPTFAIVGAGIPVALGAALTAQTLDQDRVAVAVFGDGATNIGAFHESLNLASVWSLPVLFLCENNHFGEYSRIDVTTPFEDLTRRAEAYDIEARTLDGQDLDAATGGLRDAVAAVRNGSGPQFVEMKTYRYSGHSRSDTAPYRDPEELARWLARDPIAILRSRLLDEGHITSSEVAEIESRVGQRIEDATTAAFSSEYPPTSAMFNNIFATTPMDAT